MAGSSANSTTAQPSPGSPPQFLVTDSEQDLFDIFMQEPTSQGDNCRKRFRRMLRGIFGKDRVKFPVRSEPFQTWTRGDVSAPLETYTGFPLVDFFTHVAKSAADVRHTQTCCKFLWDHGLVQGVGSCGRYGPSTILTVKGVLWAVPRFRYVSSAHQDIFMRDLLMCNALTRARMMELLGTPTCFIDERKTFRMIPGARTQTPTLSPELLFDPPAVLVGGGRIPEHTFRRDRDTDGSVAVYAQTKTWLLRHRYWKNTPSLPSGATACPAAPAH
ncbi:hypothetical protein V8F20_004050 [Naviculisporaceae sp. PSN 640]